jgi:hypothetical protein
VTAEGGLARVAAGPGPYEIQVRRVGYEPLKGANRLRLQPGDTVVLRLATGCDRSCR